MYGFLTAIKEGFTNVFNTDHYECGASKKRCVDPNADNPYIIDRKKLGPPNPRPIPKSRSQLIQEGIICKGGKGDFPISPRPKLPEGQSKYVITGLPIVKKVKPPKMKKPKTEWEKLGVSENYYNWIIEPKIIGQKPNIVICKKHRTIYNKTNDYCEQCEQNYLKQLNKKKTPYILCSAIWVDNKKEYVHQPKNIKSGFVACGQRHCNCFVILQLIGISYKNRCIQGFLTSDNKFVDRAEGAKIAFKSKQTEEHCVLLQSEDIF